MTKLKNNPMKTNPKNNGGDTDYYSVPHKSRSLIDLIEHKDMSFWRGEAFKALYALEERAERSSEARELNKVIYYCQRRLSILKKQSKN